jgi:ABC-type phosphate/phosphonate transport system substrate-binding protein
MKWKIALPMYNVSTVVRDGYENLAVALIDRLRADGWRDEVDLVRETGDLPQFWSRQDVLLSQACGYPYMTVLRGRVRLLATPCYAFPGCSGADYSSAIMVREEDGFRALGDVRGGVAAVNDGQSNSGMNLLRHAVSSLAHDGGFFSSVKYSGSHTASLAMLRNGEADIAAIDCVTLAYVRQEHPGWLKGLKALQYSAPTPGLPFIASRALPQDWLIRLRDALLEPDDDIAALMQVLHIRACAYRDEEDYAQVLRLEREAQDYGYTALA